MENHDSVQRVQPKKQFHAETYFFKNQLYKGKYL